MTLWNRLPLIWLLLVNLAGLAAMGADKYKARHHQWRIPEKTLFLIAIVGGSAGSLAGMFLFHHKTRHLSFLIGMPLILVLQIFIAVII